ncbi:uncharacterized protein LOC132938770 [Metopolophium dirhodum]|uniref:uncharacterized protein LOC132938770 n=1 Tax=Metopolophium dirhodum TaxID=44670 RepID=UPI00298FDD1D|nr:uncharacterized protein LOC132938770 [Metopolophium dirhodum]
MLILHVFISGLTFLTAETYSTIITQTVYKKTTDALETNFENPDQDPLPGNYIFELIVRPDTCGVRIGLETFSFNQPTKKDNNSAYTCDLGLNVLKVRMEPEVQPIKLSVLCGELSGQHMYLQVKDCDVPILESPITKTIILTVTLVQLGIIEKQLWNITLSQLLGRTKEDAAENPKYSLAPDGCLQYHVEKKGIIESLNFFNGKGHYVGDLNYAICFKRYPDTCGIKFIGINFEFATNGNSSQSTDRDCDTLSGLTVSKHPTAIIGTTPINMDYVVIPDGLSTVDAGLSVHASKYCGRSLRILSEVVVVTQFPLFLGIVTDKYSDLKNLEIGFKIKYKLLTNCKTLHQ